MNGPDRAVTVLALTRGAARGAAVRVSNVSSIHSLLRRGGTSKSAQALRQRAPALKFLLLFLKHAAIRYAGKKVEACEAQSSRHL
eukprot:746140-Hanusia_phi.AAC.1